MKILFLVQIFETPNDTGSDRHFYFAKKFVQAGHEVCVITGNVDYKNAKKRFANSSGVIEKSIDSVLIKYVPVYTDFKGSFFKRFIFFLSFFLSSFWSAVREPKVDLIYAVSTPLSVGLLGVFASKIRNKPFVFEVTDVWPDAAVHTGVIKNRLLIFFAEVVERFCYKMSNSIICLTNGIAETIIRKGVQPNKTKLIPNGVDFDLFKAVDNDIRVETRKHYKFDDKFVLMYLGAHGSYNSLGTIIMAAEMLRDHDDILFVFVGDGDEKAKLIAYTTKHQLKNVNFIGTVSRIHSVKLLACADTFLLPNRKGDFFKGNLPNKLFDFLAAGKPIIVAGHGETADLVQAAGAGLVVDAENSEALANAILDILQMDTHQKANFGSSGRIYVEKNFSRNVQAELLCNLIDFK